MNFRTFTKEGSERFKALVLNRELISVSPEDFLVQVRNLAVSDEFTKNLGGDLALKVFSDRLEFAKYVHSMLADNSNEPIVRNCVRTKLFWDWMACVWLESLVSGDARSNLLEKIGESEDAQRWILIEDKTRFHRHLVSGPYFAYESNLAQIEKAMVLFARTPRNSTGNVLESGELWERLAGKTSLSTGRIVHLATLLFYDYKTNSLRTNAGNKVFGAQAFSKYFSQIDLTFDYEGMDVQTLLDMLPENLRRWVPAARKALLENR